MENLNRRFCIILFLALLWALKPIPYEEVAKNRAVSQEVLSFRGGAFDPLKGDLKLNRRDSSSNPPKTPNSGEQAPKAAEESSYPGKGIQYRPGAPSGGGYGNSDYDVDLPEDIEPDKAISDPDFWDTIQTLGESEDESQPAEATAPTPTGVLTARDIPNNNDSTQPINPWPFTDWEGENKVIKSKELTKSVYAHGYEAGVVSPEDLIPCPIQDDPDKFQRRNCARVRDPAIEKLRDKIIDLATSREPGMLKFEAPMPSWEGEQAVGHLDMITGECVLFHKNGKYWSYRKYTPEKIRKLIEKADSFKFASKNQDPKTEF